MKQGYVIAMSPDWHPYFARGGWQFWTGSSWTPRLASAHIFRQRDKCERAFNYISTINRGVCGMTEEDAMLLAIESQLGAT